MGWAGKSSRNGRKLLQEGQAEGGAEPAAGGWKAGGHLLMIQKTADEGQ